MLLVTEVGLVFDENNNAELEGFYVQRLPHLGNLVRFSLKKNFDRWANSADFLLFNGMIPQVRNLDELKAVLRYVKTYCNPGWGESQDLSTFCRCAVRQYRYELYLKAQQERKLQGDDYAL